MSLSFARLWNAPEMTNDMQWERSVTMAAADQSGKSSKKLSLDVVQELLKGQENSFKTLVSSLLTNFNDRFDKLTREVYMISNTVLNTPRKTSKKLSQSYKVQNNYKRRFNQSSPIWLRWKTN